MKQKEKKARNRRTNEQIDKEVISELEKLVAEYGFGNANLSALMKAANIEANVFYRRYASMENLYDRLAKIPMVQFRIHIGYCIVYTGIGECHLKKQLFSI